ncbi:ras-related protein RABC2a-like [Mercurialis annua]|uniref:ras-related protein RABC2a-like n=1 Tax=Mercurialis annua TaxID=3986 RepID=UPI00215E68BD|nr:ras-related protein RABC2a-like [Mercurialis annua]
MSDYDHPFKIVLIGDQGVGKSSLLVSFVSGAVTDLPSTIGTDIKIKQITVGGKRLKLTFWDTAGQERFRTLTSSYYRDAHGIILVYDVTRKQSFTNLANLWIKEVDLYSTNIGCIKMLVGNKVDKESERAVSREEGMDLAKQLGFLFVESSAKTRENVEKCFDDLALKILEESEKKRQEELKQKHSESEPKSENIKLPGKSKETPQPYTGPPSGGGACCNT